MSEWLFEYTGFDPDDEGTREALCTLGNGYFATRGAAPEATSDDVHHPGTYIAGIYNRLATEVSGRMVDNESLVNAPNWLPVRFRSAGGPWFGDDGTEVLEHGLVLDMQRGVLTRRSRLRDVEGRIVVLTQRRFVSMRDPHLGALETTLSPENWAGTLEVESALDGTVRNDGVARYAGLDDVHLSPVRQGRLGDDVISLVVETSQSHIRIAEAARTHVRRNGEDADVTAQVDERPGFVAWRGQLVVEEGDEVGIEKVVALFTSRDDGISEAGEEADDLACHRLGTFDELLARHVISWRHVWDRIRIEIGTDHDVDRNLHLQLFHIVQTVSNNSAMLDVGVPARGLHGEAYRGHIFWDELFIMPLLSVRLPALARSLLLYRYRRLDQARHAAADELRRGDAGAPAGAMFPWQSASNGRETTQTMHLNPRSGRWVPDASHLQRHVGAAIAYNVWQYFEATNDVEFLRFYGAELMLEIARFWATIATYDHLQDRYSIRGVMGPDEYHERYPDREEPGLDNNAYTNLMAVWCLCRAFDVLEVLPPVSAAELQERLGITEQELDRWEDVSRKMTVCFHDGVISQFEGYEKLEELDLDAYQRRYGDIQRLDRILEAEGDSPNRYRIAKQPDVTMLFYLLSRDELASLFERLGYEFDDDLIARNTAYYSDRNVDGSTLSRVVLAWIQARLDRKRSWELFNLALGSDINDVQGGTTSEGIHLGAMAGSVDLLQRCYTGLELRPNMLKLKPSIPDALGSLAFDIRYRGHIVHLSFTKDTARVHVDLVEGAPITVDIRGEVQEVAPGETFEVSLR